MISSVGKLMCSQRVQIASGSHILTHASFIPILSNCWNQPFAFHDVSRDSPLVSIERSPVWIQPLGHCSSLNGRSFCQRFVLCTVFPHCILQRPPQRWVFWRVSFFLVLFLLWARGIPGLSLWCCFDMDVFWTKDILKDQFSGAVFVAAIRFQQAVKKYIMSYLSSSCRLVTLEFWLSHSF